MLAKHNCVVPTYRRTEYNGGIIIIILLTPLMTAYQAKL